MTIEVTSIDKSDIRYFYPFLDRMPHQDEGAVGLIMDDEAAGIGIFYVKDSTCIIRQFYIDPAFRRKGGGTRLLESVKEVLCENGIGSFIFYNENDKHKPTLFDFMIRRYSSGTKGN